MSFIPSIDLRRLVRRITFTSDEGRRLPYRFQHRRRLMGDKMRMYLQLRQGGRCCRSPLGRRRRTRRETRGYARISGLGRRRCRGVGRGRVASNPRPQLLGRDARHSASIRRHRRVGIGRVPSISAPQFRGRENGGIGRHSGSSSPMGLAGMEARY